MTTYIDQFLASSHLIKCRFMLLSAFALDKLAKAGLDGAVATAMLNLIGATFVPSPEIPKSVSYQGILAMKHIMGVESLEASFRHKVLVAIISQIEVSTYDSFFDLVVSTMK